MNLHKRIDSERTAPELQHERLRELLFEYALLQMGAAPPGPQWHELQQHLATCTTCMSELDELRQILIDTYSGAIEPTTPAAEPDLSFLPFLVPVAAANQVTSASPTPIALPQAARPGMRQIIVQFTQALLDTLRQPVLAGGFRGAKHYCSYTPPHSNDDVQVTIDISISDEERKLCRVLVCVVHPAQPFDQEGSQVTLRFGTFTRQAVTDHQGYAPFEDIPLDFIPQLRFTIVPQPPN